MDLLWHIYIYSNLEIRQTEPASLIILENRQTEVMLLIYVSKLVLWLWKRTFLYDCMNLYTTIFRTILSNSMIFKQITYHLYIILSVVQVSNFTHSEWNIICMIRALGIVKNNVQWGKLHRKVAY